MSGPLEVAVIMIIALLLFGTKRLPVIGRAAGQGVREFRKALKDNSGENSTEP